MVTVLEVHALYFVFVNLHRGINLSSCEVGLRGLVRLHSDVRDNERASVSFCLTLLTGFSIDVGGVLLFLQLGERQTVAFRVHCNTIALLKSAIAHVHGVLTRRQALLCQRVWSHLVPVTLLINQVDVTTCDLFRVT